MRLMNWTKRKRTSAVTFRPAFSFRPSCGAGEPPEGRPPSHLHPALVPALCARGPRGAHALDRELDGKRRGMLEGQRRLDLLPFDERLLQMREHEVISAGRGGDGAVRGDGHTLPQLAHFH